MDLSVGIHRKGMSLGASCASVYNESLVVKQIDQSRLIISNKQSTAINQIT